jgi:hypothetical protein
MTLGNMRANGVRALDVHAGSATIRTILSADPWSDDVPVPAFGPRMVCTRCGTIGADARPKAAAAERHWHRAMAMSAERHRALEILAGSSLGCTEAMSASGERRHPSAGDGGGY